jgi:recombination directionality factor gp3-like protein
MSPVYGIQRRMRELGRIRTGDQVPDKNGKARAHMLETFRLTSADAGILQLAAQAYGGEVRPWEGGPADGLFELYTDRSSIAIAVPPSEEPYSQWYELWSAGGCQRRCNGSRVTVPTKQGLRDGQTSDPPASPGRGRKRQAG